MTTEERFTRIENTLHAVSEIQAQHESAIRDLIVVSRTLLESQKETTTQMRQVRESQQDLAETDRSLEKKLAETQQDVAEIDRRLGKKLDAFAALSADTEEKLNALIEVVDRIIRRQNGKS